MPRGGKREGAGRPTGSRWKPAVAAFRADAVEKMSAIVGRADDPLSVIAQMVVDPTLDISTRLTAANTCLPFLYPRLSASQVDARHTVTKIDAGELLRRIDDRVARIASSKVPVIEHANGDESNAA